MKQKEKQPQQQQQKENIISRRSDYCTAPVKNLIFFLFAVCYSTEKSINADKQEHESASLK